MNKLKKLFVMSLGAVVCLCLSMIVFDESALENLQADKSLFNQLELVSAHARETRAERRARVKEERRMRRQKRENKNKTPEELEQELAAASTETVVVNTKEDNKPGPKKFSQDMLEMIKIEGEKTEAELALEKQQQEEAAKLAAEENKIAEATAQEEEKTTNRRRKKRERTKRSRKSRSSEEAATQSQAMRGEVYTQLEEAQQLFGNKQYDQALAVLDRLNALSGRKALQSYEKANVMNFYAFVYYSQEKYDQAIDAYRKVLQQPDLPKAMVDKTQYTLAQLHMVKEDYPSAIKAFEKWFATAEKVGPESHATLSQAYVQVKNYDKALYHMKKTLQAAHAQGKRPKEQWYEVLRFLYNEKGQVRNQLSVVQILLRNWPKKKYWLGLAGLYGETDNMAKQMEILNTLYIQGDLQKEQEIVSLAQMFAAADVPYKAAKIMQRGIDQKKVKPTNKNLERTGEYWRQAQEMERALPMLEDASQKAPDGKSSERLAYIYYDLGDFNSSAKAAARAIAKGGLRDVNNVRMLMGQALFNVEKFDEASIVFKRVFNSSGDETVKATASQWMDFMEREKVRVQEVKQYLGA